MAQTWRLDHSTVLDNDGNPVAIIADPAGDGGEIEWPWVYDEALPESHVQAEANAVLIIAAPDLLAAAQAALKHWGTLPSSAEMGTETPGRVGDLLSAAIAKATQEVTNA
jgi:hypothetical protein